MKREVNIAKGLVRGLVSYIGTIYSILRGEMDFNELIRKYEAISLKLEEENMITSRGRMKVKGEKIAAHCRDGNNTHRDRIRIDTTNAVRVKPRL